MAVAPRDPVRQKELGAFYTPPAMAAKLVGWAVRSPGDRVLDPSFGGLVFLRAAGDRLLTLGADRCDVPGQLYGVDLDGDAHAAAALQADLGLPRGALLHKDFFAASPESDIPLCQAVVGNPPYIRYQDFNGSAARAHELAASAGVNLTRLASSWAPFLVHATSFVAPRGRLAQVLPAELLHARYAMEVIDFLRRSFRHLSIAVFDERVFPGALEEVVLLFADDRGEGEVAEVRLVSAETVADLELSRLDAGSPAASAADRVPFDRSRLLSQLLPGPARLLYWKLAACDDVHRLGELAAVDIGVVTGANDFFTLTAEEASGLAPALVRPAVSKAAQMPGARLSRADHNRMLRDGHRALLLVACPGAEKHVLETVEPYLVHGESIGIHQRYKCRARDPWWALPLPKTGVPDLLLTYCANQHPRLVLNEARVLQTNTIHSVKLAERALAPAVTAAFYNSLTLLSAELVGRSYGGGVLKLEPTEAEALLLPPFTSDVGDLLPSVDQSVRCGRLEQALDLVDRAVLGTGLGLAAPEIAALRAGAEHLRARRLARGRRPQASTT